VSSEDGDDGVRRDSEGAAMSVPSYDDLTPGIPNVIDSEKVDQLALFLDACQRPTPGSQCPSGTPLGSWESGVGNLYACLRGQPIDALLAVARDFSPRVRRVSDGEVLLDVSGLGRLIGPPPEIERQLARAVGETNATASVAIAPTQTAARLLAHAETAHGHQDHKALCDLCDLRGLCAGACGRGPWLPLPVEFLRELETLPPATNDRDRARPYDTFQRWGIATLGELAALPAAELSSRLGRRGVALQRLARGLDPAPFVPDGETPRFIGRLELDWPIDTLEPLSFVFARLLEPLSSSLERADRGAAAIRLDLRLTDRSTRTRTLQLPAPMRDPRVLRTLLLLDLESHPSPSPSPLRGSGETSAVTTAVDVVSIELDPAPSRITQFSLLQRALPSPETLSTLTARLSALVGESRAGAAVLLDTHEPGAFEMERYAPDGAKGADGAGAYGVERATEAVLRRQRVPPAIRVSVEKGRPVHVAASRRGLPHGAVVQAAGPWRTSGGWWNVPTGHAWNRDEWDVALSNGMTCRLFQDRASGRWFLEGLYD
jgi:protein ImuB